MREIIYGQTQSRCRKVRIAFFENICYKLLRQRHNLLSCGPWSSRYALDGSEREKYWKIRL